MAGKGDPVFDAFLAAWIALPIGGRFYLMPEDADPAAYKARWQQATKGWETEFYPTEQEGVSELVRQWYPAAIYAGDHKIVPVPEEKK